MLRKAVNGFAVILLLSYLTVLIPNIPLTWAQGTIYIRSDGTVDPPTAPIQQSGSLYTLTGDIYDPVVVQRSNIIVYGAGRMIQGTSSYYGIEISGLTNITIMNLHIAFFDYGIYVASSDHVTISGNTLTNNNGGIRIGDSVYNTISGNIVSSNIFEGIYLYYSSDTRISTNLIDANTFDGVYLFSSSNNTISENIISNNAYGLSPYYSTNNTIYHNSFINNQFSVNPNEPLDIWDNSYPLGGNYWSDYTGVDQKSGPSQDQPGSDGIIDLPYVIDLNNRDNYPLIDQFNPKPWDINRDGYVNAKDAISLGQHFGAQIGMPNYLRAADVNLDGFISAKDAIVVGIHFGE